MADDRAGWESAGLLPSPPPPVLDEDQTVKVGEREYWECGHTGWHLMLAWLAGPVTLTRYPDNVEHYWDVTEHTESGVRNYRRPVTADERREIEDHQNSYLYEVGLPADRPYGYRWFQVLPQGRTAGDIHVAANESIVASGLRNSHHPREAVPFIRHAIGYLYS